MHPLHGLAKSLLTVSQVYPRFWPNLGLLYATAAKLEAYAGDSAKALLAARQGLEIMAACNPDAQSVIDELLRIRHECEGGGSSGGMIGYR